MLVIKNSALRKAVKIAVPFVIIPIIAVIGSAAAEEKKHLLFSLAAAVFSLLLFSAGFENKKIGSRRMVICSVMIALCVVGRFIPFFKPITAITVITAVYLGGEAGFLVGSMSALISNFYFGQGPWTAFQMLAWGLIGFAAGFLANSLKRHKAPLLIYGVVSGVLYSLVMDMWTVMWYDGSPELSMYLAAITAAVPHTVLYAVSNLVFLFLLAEPFGEKLERIKIKYGL